VHRHTDEKPTTRFRSDRFFTSQGQWFFNTREGTTEGPFASRTDAESALVGYLLEQGIKTADVWYRAGDNR
jgi:hypothetical protein